MARTIDQLLSEALLLPEGDRAQVAARLLESLDEAKDEAVDEAWAAEIERRCADRDLGRTSGADWEDVRRRIESAIFGR
jgi:putative addiction module component (TIGR02574 family)